MTTTPYTPIALTSLTTVDVSGTGAFDVLMRANKAHLEQEYKAGRIKGTEYADVYLGSMQTVLNGALQFVLQREQLNLDLALKAQQVLLAEAQVRQIEKEILMADKKLALADKEIALGEQKIQVALIEADVARAKLANVPKEGALLDAQTAVQTQQALNLASEKLSIEARTQLTNNQAANAVIEGTVLVAQECKLRGEYDLVLQTKVKTVAEQELLAARTRTELAQTSATAASGSILGRQAELYRAQAEGFAKDASIKEKDLLVKAWSVARTTDPDNTSYPPAGL